MVCGFAFCFSWFDPVCRCYPGVDVPFLATQTPTPTVTPTLTPTSTATITPSPTITPTLTPSLVPTSTWVVQGPGGSHADHSVSSCCRFTD